MNLTLEETDIVMGENERREICVVPLLEDFSRHIPIKVSYQQDTAMGNNIISLEYVWGVIRALNFSTVSSTYTREC